MQTVYTLTKNGSSLSGFYPNDIPDVFAFRQRDTIIFSSKEEAEEYLDYIQKEVNDPDNQERYGKYANRHRNTAKKLRIAERY